MTETIIWDTSDIIDNQVAYLMEENPGMIEEEAYSHACDDYGLLSFEWDDVCDSLTNWLEELDKGNGFRVEGRKLGWMNRDGYLEVGECKGKDFLSKVLPDTECTFTIEKHADRLEIKNSHHDSPTGEYYTVLAK